MFLLHKMNMYILSPKATPHELTQWSTRWPDVHDWQVGLCGAGRASRWAIGFACDAALIQQIQLFAASIQILMTPNKINDKIVP